MITELTNCTELQPIMPKIYYRHRYSIIPKLIRNHSKEKMRKNCIIKNRIIRPLLTLSWNLFIEIRCQEVPINGIMITGPKVRRNRQKKRIDFRKTRIIMIMKGSIKNLLHQSTPTLLQNTKKWSKPWYRKEWQKISGSKTKFSNWRKKMNPT